MTLLPATFIRTALAFLAAGGSLGGWMMVAPLFDWPVPGGTRLMHIHFLTVGFFLFMVMGVALWMFPAPHGAGREGIARREPLGWWAYGLLTGGLLLRAVLTFGVAWVATAAGAAAVVISATAQVAGVGCFAVSVWDRTYPRPFHGRTETRGETK